MGIAHGGSRWLGFSLRLINRLGGDGIYRRGRGLIRAFSRDAEGRRGSTWRDCIYRRCWRTSKVGVSTWTRQRLRANVSISLLCIERSKEEQD